jgi:small subunit ribosomal protein S15
MSLDTEENVDTVVAINAEKKAAVVKEYQRQEGDTGSPEVQIAILTAKIRRLTEHFKTHIHDFHSRRGLLRMVSNRRKHLKYIKKTNLDGYRELIARLGLRS